jgi:glycosyltransferase involved in cell wall biosynthesis
MANISRLNHLDRMFADKIDRNAYDVVFVHHCQFRQSPALLRFTNTPTVYYLQEPPRWIYDPPIARPYSRPHGYRAVGEKLDPLPLLYKEYLASCDKRNTQMARLVLTNSCFSREAILRIYNVDVATCYLGVDTSKFRPLDLQREQQVISVGMLTPAKGFDFLIESLAAISAGIRPRLTLVYNFAHEAERAFLARLAQRLNVSIDFKNLVEDDELVELYNRATAVLYAPILEPFGFVPLESMASGTPVIGVREGGIRETIVDGVTGFLVDRDPAAMARALDRLLAYPQEIEELGRRGREYVCQVWTWERTMTVLEQHLEQAANLRLSRKNVWAE